MAQDPIPENEDPEIDDGTLSDVIRKPTRTAGDLSEVADSSAGITTEDVARDLESVASKSPSPTDGHLLEDLRRRVEHIERHLGIESTDADDEGLHEVSKVVKAPDLDDPDDFSADVLQSIPGEALSDESDDQVPDDHPPQEDTSRQQPPECGLSGPHLGPGSI